MEGEAVSPLTRTACVALLVPEIATPPPHRTQTIPRPPLGSSQASPRNNSHSHSHTHLSTLIKPLSTTMSVPNTPCVTVSIIVMNTTVLYVRTKGSTVYSTELYSCAIGILCMYVYTIIMLSLFRTVLINSTHYCKPAPCNDGFVVYTYCMYWRAMQYSDV